jgi:hypothetical protein
LDDVPEERGRGRNQDDVIHIDQEVCHGIALLVDEQ